MISLGSKGSISLRRIGDAWGSFDGNLSLTGLLRLGPSEGVPCSKANVGGIKLVNQTQLLVCILNAKTKKFLWKPIVGDNDKSPTKAGVQKYKLTSPMVSAPR